MLKSYLPILIMMVFATVAAILPLVINYVMSNRNPYKEKNVPWECGMAPIGEANKGYMRVHFFVIAILFVVFDVETLFLFPWAVLLDDPSIIVFLTVEMFIFIGVLGLGLAYAWVKGALEWL